MKQAFIEKLLYLKFRDRAFSNKDEFKSVLSKYPVNLEKLYLKINKYQIKKYGKNLHYDYVRKVKK